MRIQPAERSALAISCALALASACAPAQEELPEATTRYYWGTAKVLAPDESVVYAENNVLMMRTVDPAAETIVEDVYQNNDPVDPTAVHHFPTALRLVEGEVDVFDLEDPSGAATGTLTYTGEPWRWDGWAYDLVFTDAATPPTQPGSTLVGSAKVTADGGFATRKEFRDPGGALIVVLVEEVAPVDEAFFTARQDGPWTPE